MLSPKMHYVYSTNFYIQCIVFKPTLTCVHYVHIHIIIHILLFSLFFKGTIVATSMLQWLIKTFSTHLNMFPVFCTAAFHVKESFKKKTFSIICHNYNTHDIQSVLGISPYEAYNRTDQHIADNSLYHEFVISQKFNTTGGELLNATCTEAYFDVAKIKGEGKRLEMNAIIGAGECSSLIWVQTSTASFTTANGQVCLHVL